jgi:hypothetical protein
MEHDRFELLARSFAAASSRRGVLRAFASSGLIARVGWRLAPPGVEAMNKHGKMRKKKARKRPSTPAATCMPNCSDRTCGADGCGGICGNCAVNQRCQGGVCVCVPESPAATCNGRCGIWTNTCGQPVVCVTCPADRICLGNGSCAEVCVFGSCPAGCECGWSDEGPQTCYTNVSTCLQIPQVCASTAECPPGQFCQGSSCGPGGSQQNRCWPICTG